MAEETSSMKPENSKSGLPRAGFHNWFSGNTQMETKQL